LKQRCFEHGAPKDLLEENMVIEVADQNEFLFPSLAGGFTREGKGVCANFSLRIN
jgi:hypothetical protein